MKVRVNSPYGSQISRSTPERDVILTIRNGAEGVVVDTDSHGFVSVEFMLGVEKVNVTAHLPEHWLEVVE